MLEIYNDECRDLLHPEIPTTDIALREDKDGKIFFTGAREELVTGTNAALRFLEMGNSNRSTAETLMNQTSSRSHAIFTISMELLDYKVMLYFFRFYLKLFTLGEYSFQYKLSLRK